MENDIEKTVELLRKEREINKRFAETPEAKHQAELFLSWACLAGIGTPRNSPEEHSYWCPSCQKWEVLSFPCGLTIRQAINLLSEEIPRHASEKTSIVHRQIRQEVK